MKGSGECENAGMRRKLGGGWAPAHKIREAGKGKKAETRRDEKLTKIDAERTERQAHRSGWLVSMC